MDINRIGRSTIIHIDLTDFTHEATAGHLTYYSKEIEKIIEKVVTHLAGPDETVKVEVMGRKEMDEEAEHLGLSGDLRTQLIVSVTQEFPL